MKRMWIAVVTLLVACASALASPPQVDWGTTEPTPPVKDGASGVPNPPPPGVLVGGDNFGSATPIPGLPYADPGNTCGYINDYTPSCASSNAPDVVYSYRPPTNMCVDASLCGSAYDTILWIVDGSSGGQIACNDDACGLQSDLQNVSLTGGTTYYFIIDGYSTACGDYSFSLSECPPPCSADCPPGAILENEPLCGTGYIDNFNGGCNSTPPVHTPVLCNDTGVSICGQYGTFVGSTGGNTRDTDWYYIYLDRTMTITYCICGLGPTQALIVDANHGCPVTNVDILAAGTAAANEQVCLTLTLNAGYYWLWAGTSGFTGVPCGTRYLATISGYDCPPVAVQPAQWSGMKVLYR